MRPLVPGILFRFLPPNSSIAPTRKSQIIQNPMTDSNICEQRIRQKDPVSQVEGHQTAFITNLMEFL
jgi:hypothetical protein